MSRHGEGTRGARIWTWAAAAVHTFTASGAVCALLAVLALDAGRYEVVFFWLFVALVIDGIDGTFARWVDVRRRLPRFSGEQLDLVVDYITYVLVPVLALLKAGLLSGISGVVLACWILLTSLFHFSDTASKTADNCFVGFPALWNLVAFYLFAFGAGPGLTAGVVVLLGALAFVPQRWVHPLRVSRWRGLTLAVCTAGLLGSAVVLWQGFPAGFAGQIVLGAVALYGLATTALLPLARPSGEGS